MRSAHQEVCPSCQQVLATPVSRCPGCGFLLAAAPAKVYQDSLPPRRARPSARERPHFPLGPGLVGLALTLVLVLAGFWLVRRHDDERAARLVASAVSPPTAVEPTAALVVLDPTRLFGQAKAQAVAWHTDATLLEIDIAPVLMGKVDPGGKLVFRFGKPAGRKLGPGTAVQATGFVVTADAAGLRGEERPMGKALSAAEPNCIFEDVLGKLQKAGVSSTEPLRFQYAMSEKNSRGVWRVSRASDGGERTPETLRTLDGANCAIIVH